MASAHTSSAGRDSELEHSFGPHEIGFDFLPLELPPHQTPPLPRTPAERVPVFDLNGSEPLPDAAPAAPFKGAPPRASGQPRGAGEIWLDGDAILCACPDCRAPMSVRFWLMMADCWRCGASIELTEEQEREVQRLLAERERQAAVEQRATPQRPAAIPPPARDRPTRPAQPDRGPHGPRSPADERFRGPPPTAPPTRVPPPGPARQAGPTLSAPLQPSDRLWRLLSDMPAWLISLLVHLILLTLLALLTTADDPDEGNFITLSTVLSRETPREGGDTIEIRPEDMAAFDLPLPSKADLSNPRKREALLAAAQDARELRLDDPPPNLPSLDLVRSKVGRADGYEVALAARDPRLRVEMVTKEGGTTMTEAAVARGLRWLANHQNRDGSWSLADFAGAADCNCSGEGHYHTKSPGTALAMLPFLGAGQTHLAGKYKGTVGRGLRWLIENQQEDGDLRAGANGNEGMYTHGQAAIVLCEAFAMTGDEALREPAQRSIDFIVAAQYNDGGWRYQPEPRSQRGDTSVVGWQLMALQSARSANLRVPEETWGMAELFLEGVQHRDGALYGYQAHSSPTEAMTAEALLCRMYLGWTSNRPGLVRGVEWLTENHMPDRNRPNIYYWYYATQTLHHVGGPEWEEWNLQMRDILTSTQETRGHAAGSWAPKGSHSEAGGRIYMTALAICTLEVYYRHLPIFRRIELGE